MRLSDWWWFLFESIIEDGNRVWKGEFSGSSRGDSRGKKYWIRNLSSVNKKRSVVSCACNKPNLQFIEETRRSFRISWKRQQRCHSTVVMRDGHARTMAVIGPCVKHTDVQPLTGYPSFPRLEVSKRCLICLCHRHWWLQRSADVNFVQRPKTGVVTILTRSLRVPSCIQITVFKHLCVKKFANAFTLENNQ